MAPKKGKKVKKNEVDEAKTEETLSTGTSQATENAPATSKDTVASKKTTRGKKQEMESLEEAAAALQISEDDVSPETESREKARKKDAPTAPRPETHMMNETFVVLPQHRYYTRSKITQPLKEDQEIEENQESDHTEPGPSKVENSARPARKRRAKAKAKENVTSEIEDEDKNEAQTREKSTEHQKSDPSAENH